MWRTEQARWDVMLLSPAGTLKKLNSRPPLRDMPPVSLLSFHNSLDWLQDNNMGWNVAKPGWLLQIMIVLIVSNLPYHHRCKSVRTLWEDTCRGGCQEVPETERGAGEAKGGPQKCADFTSQGEEAAEGGGEEWHRSETNHTHSTVKS